MTIRPASLQGRITLFLILPVTALLVVMGVIGFFFARDLLLHQWRAAAILKLQRVAHQMDMHLTNIKAMATHPYGTVRGA
jgi:sigma-B regulation protein RsbU (phosphoserine phosphatase)